MNAKQTLIHVAAALTLAALATPAAHANTEEQGVKCPDSSPSQTVTATLSADRRTLTCKVEDRVVRASVCSPLIFKNNGSFDINFRIDQDNSGSDTCRARNTAGVVIATAPSQALLLPGDNPANFHRDVSSGAADEFVWTKPARYVYPVGHSFSGDESKGVQCQSGYDGESRFGGRGLRCKGVDARRADCDTLWTIKVRNGTDKCVMQQDVFGAKIEIEGQYTIPSGTSGIGGNPSNFGWTLVKDKEGNTDYWTRDDFNFPRARN